MKKAFLTLLLLIFVSVYSQNDPVRFAKEASVTNAWIEISSSNFIHNIRETKKLLNGKSELCAVIKADAYGHGIKELLPFLIQENIQYIAFAANQEAQKIRSGGYKGKLMRVRAATYQEIKEAFEYEVEELAGNLETAVYMDQLVAEKNTKIKVHLALNSMGMSRNGLELSTEKGKQDTKKITELKNLYIVGVMSHFPVEDKEEVKKGMETFEKDTEWLFAHTGLIRNSVKLHVANSYATIEVPETHLDMVRVGGVLYGDMSPEIPRFKKLMTLKSKVAQVNEYPKGNTVGYDKTYTLTRDSRLANIPVGYSDGYRRIFSNKGNVLINGHRIPVVGKISMNTIMVDVTDFQDVKALDEVVLFGKQEQEEITQDEIEEINGALLGDLSTIWGKVNPRMLVE